MQKISKNVLIILLFTILNALYALPKNTLEPLVVGSIQKEYYLMNHDSQKDQGLFIDLLRILHQN